MNDDILPAGIPVDNSITKDDDFDPNDVDSDDFLDDENELLDGVPPAGGIPADDDDDPLEEGE